MATTQPTDPGAMIRQLLGDALAYLYPASLRVIIRLEIPELLADRPRTAAELAEATGADASHLQRILRYLSSRGVFQEDETGAFHATGLSEPLRADARPSVRQTVLLLTDDIYWRSTGRLEDIVRTGKTVFDDLFGAPLFELLAGDPERAALFDSGIAAISVLEQEAIAAAYEFPEGARVVDVGGGPGGLLNTVLRRNPTLRGVLFEQESVLAKHILDDSLSDRWSTAAGDFFTAVPEGEDFYVLKRVLHDWNDEDSLKILRSCRAALPEHGRVLVVDAVIPPGNEPHASKLYDVAMMTIFDGKERTEEEFTRLLSAADLKVARIIPTPGTLSVVEAVPA
ncbi:methyltransferase [Amycolatopsis sp. H20-H5]|uniref:methyltransferase n=1 Tax=Amycolatopsis sp. H20-H5 TaxID=3046309 RepID=UPI002DB77ECB|nr:methyltransferase [Amycolatopsis sp. H20-H5]MEC3975009.1 methyltransferase [Amycolatopsis sp. H20-H5]